MTVKTTREAFTKGIVPVNTDVSNALYTHSKILVAALNGPVMGISAAFLGHFDFIYALPSAWLSVPFTFLGIIAEAGSSVTFRNRMGAAKANEVLIWGKKKDAQELLDCGFINKIFPEQPVPEFHAAVRKLVLAEMDGLEPTALLGVKRLVKAGLNDQHSFDAVNMRESYAQADRFASGVPSARFEKIARKELRHKL
ncbi:3,2-trans-enoyl-CoA isomerase [Trametes pubescens]|uniref:3,2-trans-enoyl-CoA isomerase n=1 Tax=Trametes pubescens TaxID=154538 RepID=A0A1M2W7P6_TRAPU|nr:3,2-trans-enoyl-CoA isomerase [Trametes pubescens]